MKMRRTHLVPLSTQVTELFKQLKPITGHYPYIFIGRNNRSKPISKESVSQVIELLGYKGRATGHGFRHSMSTILHEQGFDSAWIEMQLAHVDKNNIRGTYNHAQYIEKRRYMLQWYADRILPLYPKLHYKIQTGSLKIRLPVITKLQSPIEIMFVFFIF